MDFIKDGLKDMAALRKTDLYFVYIVLFNFSFSFIYNVVIYSSLNPFSVSKQSALNFGTMFLVLFSSYADCAVKHSKLGLNSCTAPSKERNT